MAPCFSALSHYDTRNRKKDEKRGRERVGCKKIHITFKKKEKGPYSYQCLFVSARRRPYLLLVCLQATLVFCSQIQAILRSSNFPMVEVCFPFFVRQWKKRRETRMKMKKSLFCCCYRKPPAHETKKRKPELSQLLIVLTLLC